MHQNPLRAFLEVAIKNPVKKDIEVFIGVFNHLHEVTYILKEALYMVKPCFDCPI